MTFHSNIADITAIYARHADCSNGMCLHFGNAKLGLRVWKPFPFPQNLVPLYC